MRRSNDERRIERVSRNRRGGGKAVSVVAGGLIVGLMVSAGAAAATQRHNPPVVSEVCGPGNPAAATTLIGQPYLCSYAVQDTDGLHDGITVSDIADVIQTAGGAVNSGNILSSLPLIFDPGTANPSAMPTCTGGSGAGTTASPYVGATQCTIPWDAGVETNAYSFYTVAGPDYGLASHRLSDTMTVTWQSLCSSPGGSGISCPVGNQFSSIGGSTIVKQLASETNTEVLNSSDAPVTSVVAGTAVHDFVTVSPGPGDPASSPTPTGNVTVSWFSNGTCSGSATKTSGPLALGAGGQVDASSFSVTPTGAGQYGFQGTYNGDSSNPAYTGSTGSCEPLTVTDTQAITSGDHATATSGVAFSFEVTTSGTPVPTITKSGLLPKHLKLTNNGDGTASISGTTTKVGVVHIVIRANFGTGQTKTVVRQHFTLTINPSGGPE